MQQRISLGALRQWFFSIYSDIDSIDDGSF